MYLNQFEKSNNFRLNQILHTLKTVHGIGLSFDLSSSTIQKDLIEAKANYERARSKIIQESSFNSYQLNPEYTSTMLILEAVKIMLKEIAPKRKRSKRIKEDVSVLEMQRLVKTVGPEEHEIRVFVDSKQPQDYIIKVYTNDVENRNFSTRYAEGDQDLEDVVNDLMHKQKHVTGTDLQIEKLSTAMVNHKDTNPVKQAAINNVGKKLMTWSGNNTDLSDNDKRIIRLAQKELLPHRLNEQKQNLHAAGQLHNAHIHVANIKDIYENKGQPMTKIKERILETVMTQPNEYEYQASMARSELYRNAKYAMGMLKQVDPNNEVPPWIAGALTKAANYLDKVFHYLDYYKKFEPEKLPEEMDADLELGTTSGSVSRENLMLVVEYSIKLFNMIHPGEKLEGWVAMKLTTASECISSCKHYLDYVQFEKHGLDSHFDEGRRAMRKKMDEATLMEAETTEDLERAQTILSATDIKDEVQKIAEKSAELGVETLMPLVDAMMSHFGTDVANGFNEAVKKALDELLAQATKSKEEIQQAITTLQAGGVPGAQSDLEKAPQMPAQGAPEEPADAAEEPAGAPEEPLGRAKKEVAESTLNEKWDAKMHTAKKDKGKWDGYTLAELKAKKDKLMKKKQRSKDEQKTVKQLTFAIRAKQSDKWGKVDEAKKTKEPGAIATAQVKKMGKSYWTGEKLTKKGIKKRDAIIKALEKDLHENVASTNAPLGKKANEWISANAAKFMEQYGEAKGKSLLYAKAWNMFSEPSVTYLSAKAVFENKRKMLANLQEQLAIHKTQFAESVMAGITKDPLSIGYGLEGELLQQKIDKLNDEIHQVQTVVVNEMKHGIHSLVESIEDVKKIENLLNIKSQTPFGVAYTRNGKACKKMFETADTRNYWLSLHESEIKNVKMIDPETFDDAISTMLKGN